MAQQPLVGLGLVIEASWSHSVGLLWRGDQPEAETCAWQHATDRRPCAQRDSTIPASERQQTHALEYAATEIGLSEYQQQFITKRLPIKQLHSQRHLLRSRQCSSAALWHSVMISKENYQACCVHMIEQQTLGRNVNPGVVTFVTDFPPNLVILERAKIRIN